MDNIRDVGGVSVQMYTVSKEESSTSIVGGFDAGDLRYQPRLSPPIIPYQYDQPHSLDSSIDNTHGVGESSIQAIESAANPKMRKRSKTGCLTCRKRRIKCGEERPTCGNCIKSKRQCEGYNQRVMFKTPLGEWPNHPGVVSKLPYHSSMLPGTRNPGYRGDPPTVQPQDNTLTSMRPRPLTNFDFSNVETGPVRSMQANNGPKLSSIQPRPVDCVTKLTGFDPWSFRKSFYRTIVAPAYNQMKHSGKEGGKPQPFGRYDAHVPVALSNTPTHLTDAPPSYSLDSSDAIESLAKHFCDIESSENLVIRLEDDTLDKHINPRRAQEYSPIISQGVLAHYRPQHTANPIKDPHTAQAFAYYVNITGPSLSPFGMDSNGRSWALSIPTLALTDLGLLHATLALSTLQSASIYGQAVSSSLKHYAYSLKRLHRAIAHPQDRIQPSTLAVALLLGTYDLMAGDYTRWGVHHHALSILLDKIDVSTLHSKESELHVDLFWSCAKQDIYCNILSGADLSLDHSMWLKWAPLMVTNSADNARNLYHSFLPILGRIIQFAAEDRERKATQIRVQPTAGVSQFDTRDARFEKVIKDWTSIYSELENFKTLLEPNCLPLVEESRPRLMSAFGSTIFHRTYALSIIWAQIHMAHILLRRAHPLMPSSTSVAVAVALSETREDALSIGRIIAGIIPIVARPAINGVLIESTMPIFVAGIQYQDPAQRTWTVEALETIGRSTGWQPAKQASLAVQQMWERAANAGRGPRWVKDAQLEPELSNTNPFSLGEYWLLGEGYNASELLVSTGDRNALDQTDMLQFKARVIPGMESNVTIPMKFEDASDVDIVQDLAPAIGSADGISSHQNHIPLQSRCTSQGVDSSMDSEMEISGEVELKNLSPKPWAVGSSRDAPPSIRQRSASYLSDAASTNHSIFESELSMSTEEENEPLVLGTERRKIVDRVMIYFYTIFQAMPAVGYKGNEASQTRSSQIASNSSIETSSSTPDFASALHTRLGKHTRRNDDKDHSDEEDEGPPKRPKKEKIPSERKKSERKFACPYFKRDSEKYLTRRSCVGPGWDEVRRVKEHLYRNHSLPIFCRRCYTIFKADSLLDDHQRAIEPCKMRPKENIEGFDKLQLERLRSRKKSQTEPSEEDKWREVYRILFPIDDASSMPSPYLDVNWQQMYQKGKPTASNELAHYEQFLRRELPPAVRRELENAVEREFSPLEERLKSQLIDIVRDLQLQLFQSYTESRRAIVSATTIPETTFATAADDNNEPHNETGPLGLTQVGEEVVQDTTLENLLASYEPAPLLQPGSTLDFDPVQFEFDDLGEFEDSTYGSLFAGAMFPESGWEDGSPFYHDPNDNGEGPSCG